MDVIQVPEGFDQTRAFYSHLSKYLKVACASEKTIPRTLQSLWILAWEKVNQGTTNQTVQQELSQFHIPLA